MGGCTKCNHISGSAEFSHSLDQFTLQVESGKKKKVMDASSPITPSRVQKLPTNIGTEKLRTLVEVAVDQRKMSGVSSCTVDQRVDNKKTDNNVTEEQRKEDNKIVSTTTDQHDQPKIPRDQHVDDKKTDNNVTEEQRKEDMSTTTDQQDLAQEIHKDQLRDNKKTVSNVAEEKDTSNKEIVVNDHEAVKNTSTTEQQQRKTQKDLQKLDISGEIYIRTCATGFVKVRNNYTSSRIFDD